MMPAIVNAGASSGKTTRRNDSVRLAPDMRALSSSTGFRPRNAGPSSSTIAGTVVVTKCTHVMPV